MEKDNVYISRQFIVPTIHIFEGSSSTSAITSPKSLSSIQSEYNLSQSIHTNSNNSNNSNSFQKISTFENNILRKSPSSIQSDYSFDFSSIGSSIQEDDSILHSIFQMEIDHKNELAENTYKK